MAEAKPWSVRRIVAEWLKAHGADGLYDSGCFCLLDDLFECCSELTDRCGPGVKVPCGCGGGCDYHMAPMEED